MDRLYARVTEGFERLGEGEVIVASPRIEDSHGFTEKGYDTCDYGKAPNVVEIVPTATRYADRDDVVAAAERAGVKLWLTEAEYMEFWPGAVAGGFREKEFPEEGVETNQLLANPSVAAELEAAGFDAVRDFIAVSNTQPEVTLFWKHGTFAAFPAETEADPDGDSPYDVRIAGGASPAP